jgi:hypothetical protein
LLLVGGRKACKQKRGRIMKTKLTAIFFLVHSSYVEIVPKKSEIGHPKSSTTRIYLDFWSRPVCDISSVTKTPTKVEVNYFRTTLIRTETSAMFSCTRAFQSRFSLKAMCLHHYSRSAQSIHKYRSQSTSRKGLLYKYT